MSFKLDLQIIVDSSMSVGEKPFKKMMQARFTFINYQHLSKVSKHFRGLYFPGKFEGNTKKL